MDFVLNVHLSDSDVGKNPKAKKVIPRITTFFQLHKNMDNISTDLGAIKPWLPSSDRKECVTSSKQKEICVNLLSTL